MLCTASLSGPTLAYKPTGVVAHIKDKEYDKPKEVTQQEAKVRQHVSAVTRMRQMVSSLFSC